MIKSKQLFRIQMNNLFLLQERIQASNCPMKVVPPSGSPVRFLEGKVGLQNLSQEENLADLVR